MNNNPSDWQLLTYEFNDRYDDALRQQHHAARFIALAGHHLLARQPDDSNTNMTFISDKNILAGNTLSNGFRLGLQLSTLDLIILDGELNRFSGISLNGKTRFQVFEELKKQLTEAGIDVSGLRDELHFEIPAHPVVTGSQFETTDGKYFKENERYRYNCEIVLKEVIAGFSGASPVRVWPHHFDTGAIVPLVRNRQGGPPESFGLGWAIPDGMIDEPYFYLSYQSVDKEKKTQKRRALKAGEWMMPQWDGAVLRHSHIIRYRWADEQYNRVRSFFSSAIAELSDENNKS